MLSGAHFLLTYACNFECEHCFVYAGPGARGTFTIGQVREVLGELALLGTVEQVCFEGGEPSLYYPVMLEGLRLARERGFKTGIVTNAYWAVSEEDAELWLKPLAEVGVSRVSVSDDELHSGETVPGTFCAKHPQGRSGKRFQAPFPPAARALAAAERLGLDAGALSTARPTVEPDADTGEPRVAGGVMFRGRAVEKLAPGLPRRRPEEFPGEFSECPHENLRDPGRVHLDAYGNVHLCQGLSMGNMWETPLSALVGGYDAEAHPVCGPLVRGGPFLLGKLAAEHGFTGEDGYVDACHLCYLARRSLIDRFPEYLAPRQVYGL